MKEQIFDELYKDAAKRDAELIIQRLSHSEVCCENISGNLGNYQFTRLNSATRGFTTAEQLPGQVWQKLPIEYIHGGNNSEFI